MLSIWDCKTQVLQIFLQYCYNAILKVEFHCSNIVKIIIIIFYSPFPRYFSLLSLIIYVLFSHFLLSFSSALSSLQTQTSSSSQHQHHTSQWRKHWAGFFFFFFFFPFCCDAVILADDGLIWVDKRWWKRWSSDDSGDVDLAAAVSRFWSRLIWVFFFVFLLLWCCDSRQWWVDLG